MLRLGRLRNQTYLRFYYHHFLFFFFLFFFFCFFGFVFVFFFFCFLNCFCAHWLVFFFREWWVRFVPISSLNWCANLVYWRWIVLSFLRILESVNVFLWCLCNRVIHVSKKKKKKFSCVLHTANTLTCFERSFFFCTKNIGSFKNVLSHGFLKHQKNVFLHFWILQHVCKTPKGIGQYSKNNTKILFWGEFMYYSPLMFG